MIKRNYVVLFLLIGIVLFNLKFVNAGLGLSPAIIETDFQSEGKFMITFSVLAAQNDQPLYVYADGDFKDYVTFDKTHFVGPQTFNAYIDLPVEAQKPGKNFLYIRIAENKTTAEGIGVRLEVGALVLIKVPYPGQYGEISALNIGYINEGETVPVKMAIDSLGNQSLFATIKFRTYSQGNLIENYPVAEEEIENQTTKKYNFVLNNNYAAGDYNTTAELSYFRQGEPIVVTRSEIFRVGTLFVQIDNWTKEFNESKITPFEIYIESKWNNLIENIHAEVTITNNSGSVVDTFKTPPVNLDRWEKAILRGFFNAEDLPKGVYNANVTLVYAGKSTGMSGPIMLNTVKKSQGFMFSLQNGNIMVIIVLILAFLVFVMFMSLLFVIFYLVKKTGQPNVITPKKKGGKK